MRGCPKCRDSYHEVFRCKRCGEWNFEDELNDGLCDLCNDELYG
jgi:hypothetical protein